VCVCVSLSVISGNNNTLQLKLVGRTVKDKEIKKHTNTQTQNTLSKIVKSVIYLQTENPCTFISVTK